MENRSSEFVARSNEAMADPQLHAVLSNLSRAVPLMRLAGVSPVANFDELRDSVTAMKRHTLDNLGHFLTRYEAQVQAKGGQVHWAETGEDLNRIVLGICHRVGARLVVKGKSMVGEETGLREAMGTAGIEALETDLGEYIIQLADETPSHIIAPALHKSQEQVADLFLEHHDLGDRSLTEVVDIVREARQVLRERFLAADVGVTGANALVAEDGTHMLVTNEGNGDLCSTLPRVHIVLASIEKVVPAAEDATALSRVLTRSATGQPIATYTSLYGGPRREEDPDGPEEFHVVLLDDGRSAMLHGEFRDMLLCIRCSACLNHCPVYWQVGGHAYGSVYTGPMGSVLTPLLHNLEETRQLPNACSSCGRCEEVCPVRIPLPDLLRRLRAKVHDLGLAPFTERRSIETMIAQLRSPSAYRRGSRIGAPLLRWLARHPGVARRLPLAAGWLAGRDLPAPEGATFMQRLERGQIRRQGTSGDSHDG
jgi:L-lactate dehydrogenase complex protein LldF